jgi:hypothetical protein
MPRPRRRRAAAAAALAALALPACRITPDEIARIESENDLLRQQISTMRMECEQYRQIDIGVEKPPPDEPATRVEPGPGAR